MKVPGILYKGIFKVIFCFILLYGIMATIPTQALTDDLAIGGLIYDIVIIFTAGALGLWRLGLKCYKSASS